MRPAPSRTLLAALLAVTLGLGGAVLAVEPAAAATIAVSNTADDLAPAACSDDAITSPGADPSLREALCVASNRGGETEIVLEDGVYLVAAPLELGTVPGTSVSIVGAGPLVEGTGTTLRGDGSTQILNLDPGLVGGIHVTLENLVVENGHDAVAGGGAIVGGNSGAGAEPDALTIRGSFFRGNTTAEAGSLPGGAIQFIGGALTVIDSVFEGNSSGTSAGGAIAYQTMNKPGQSFTVTGTRFHANTASAPSEGGGGAWGGAIDFSDPYGRAANALITASVFEGNEARGGAGDPAEPSPDAARGGAVHVGSGTLDITRSVFDGNLAAGKGAAGSALYVSGGTVGLHYNSITGGGTAPDVADGDGSQPGAVVEAERNWWGCAAGPGGGPGCATAAGGVTSPFLTLTVRSADPLVPLGGTETTLTASLLTDSAGGSVSPAELTVFAGLPVHWQATAPAAATIAADPAPTALTGGESVARYLTNGSWGPAAATALLGTGTPSSVEFGIARLPELDAESSPLVLIGEPAPITITATGFPVPQLSASGLPAEFAADGATPGELTITGEPTAGGDFPFTVTATNAVGEDESSRVLLVRQRPAIDPLTGTVFEVGVPGSASITTSGYPDVDAIGLTGGLPAGLELVELPGGSAVITGAPSAGAGGSYPLTVTAGNGVEPDASRAFTLEVNESPRFTSDAAARFTVGSAGSTVIETEAGHPAATTLSLASALPGGVTFTPHPDGTATLAGTPVAGAGGVHTLTVSASNGVAAPAVQVFVLTVDEAPALPGPQTIAASVGTALAAAIAPIQRGFPLVSTTTVDGVLPEGVELVDLGDATVRFSGTPAAGSGGEYPVTVTVANDAGSAEMTVTLRVAEPPAFLSAASATFRVGSAASFAVEIAPGYPAASVAVTGSLPGGLAFAPSAAGGTLSGTPEAGEGGVHVLEFVAANGEFPEVTQGFSLTVEEAPAVLADPLPTTVVAGAEALFTASASGYPLPGVRWQVSMDGLSWSTVPGTSGTLTFDTTLMHDGGLYRAEFSNVAGTVTSEPALLTVVSAPGFTSPATGTFSVGGGEQSLTVVSSGAPTPEISASPGGWPEWLVLTDEGDGSATLSGTPPAGSGAAHALLLHAANGVGVDATQEFTLVVNEAPALPPALSAGFAVGTSGSVQITAVPGYPLATTLTAEGALPAGVDFVDDGDGTGRLVGTPSAGSGGVYPVTVTASNGAGGVATSAVTVTVDEAPAITSPDTGRATAGESFALTITTGHAHPVPALSTATALPGWLTLSDAGDGTATLAGTPPAGSGGTLPIAISASNGVAPDAVQTLTLTIAEPAALDPTGAAAFAAGADGSVIVTATPGHPATTVMSVSGTLPDGVTAADLGDGRLLVAGRPAAGSGGSYPLSISASNGVGTPAVMDFALTVAELGAVTSPLIADVTRGVAAALVVETGHSYPAATIAVTGPLPEGLAVSDNGDGTATISGATVAAAGSIPLSVTVANGVLPAQTTTIVLRVSDARVLALPFLLPPADGVLTGVPAEVEAGELLTVGGTGFAPFAPITLGMFSTPVELGSAFADGTGAFSAQIAVPVDASGTHTFVATGIGPDGERRLLAGEARLLEPAPGPDAEGPPGPLTPAGAPVELILWLALALFGGGLVFSARRRAGEE